MMLLLFIATPNAFFIPFEKHLSKKGYRVFLTPSLEEAKFYPTFELYDAYFLDPFTNVVWGATIIKQLKEWNLLDKLIILLPGLNENEKQTANKIVGENYITLKDSFEYAENKIVRIISIQKNKVDLPVFLNKPTAHYIKGEIEKAKRGHTSLSFIYYRLQNHILASKETNELLQKLNTDINSRLRISDDAFPFQNGILILLFGTNSKDRPIITNVIHKNVLMALSARNIDFTSYLELAEATCPDDGNSFSELFLKLECNLSKSLWQESVATLQTIGEVLKTTTPPQNLFRLKRKILEIEASAASSYLHTKYLPPTWYGTLLQICDENTITPINMQEFILNETNIGARLLQISCGIISLFHENYRIEINQIPKSLNEVFLLFTPDEVKSLICFCTLELSVMSGHSNNFSELKKLTYFQMATILELSNKISYPNKPELLLGALCQAIGTLLIKIKNADTHHLVYEKQKNSGAVIGQIFHKEIGFTPSELTYLFLHQWRMDEPMAESAYCARYENNPHFNPQLTAITHLAIVISNNISGILNETGLSPAKNCIDEILLKNRSFKSDDLNYLSENIDQWIKNYHFIFDA